MSLKTKVEEVFRTGPLDHRRAYGISGVGCSAAILLLQPAAIPLERRNGEVMLLTGASPTW